MLISAQFKLEKKFNKQPPQQERQNSSYIYSQGLK